MTQLSKMIWFDWFTVLRAMTKNIASPYALEIISSPAYISERGVSFYTVCRALTGCVFTARQSPLSPYFAWPGCGASRQRGMLSRSRPSPENIFALLEPCLGKAPGALDCARVPKFREAIQDEG